MGLDIALGVVILASAIRGWFKGFLRQAIVLAALVGCVYAADPLRDLARPYAAKNFPSIAAPVLDRLLWWSAAVISYFLVSGIGLSILKSSRKRTYGDPEPNRSDQGAGFTLGALKGAIVAAFLASGIAQYAPPFLKGNHFAEEQTERSYALKWSDRYRPAELLWNSPPVRSFVARVRTRGMWGSQETQEERTETAKIERDASEKKARPASTEVPRTASNRTKPLQIPSLDPDDPEFARKLERELRREGLEPR